MQAFTKFIGDEEGGTAIEYAFLAALIAMAAVTSMTSVGNNLSAKLDEIATALT
ncbi:MAG TPA: Flp family type IVb pilin [Candidatus Limnocylindrales bacterium]|nr:Flp family type IVb pilin [Candidatus Limnocylindrales bacterium]